MKYLTESYPETFNFEEFNNIRSYAKKLKYTIQSLRKISITMIFKTIQGEGFAQSIGGNIPDLIDDVDVGVLNKLSTG